MARNNNDKMVSGILTLNRLFINKSCNIKAKNKVPRKIGQHPGSCIIIPSSLELAISLFESFKHCIVCNPVLKIFKKRTMRIIRLDLFRKVLAFLFAFSENNISNRKIKVEMMYAKIKILKSTGIIEENCEYF